MSSKNSSISTTEVKLGKVVAGRTRTAAQRLQVAPRVEESARFDAWTQDLVKRVHDLQDAVAQLTARMNSFKVDSVSKLVSFQPPT